MSEFAKLIKEYREKKSSKLIYNASIEHAHDLFSELFKEAEETKANVHIVSGQLTEDFYGRFSDTIKKIIDKGVHVQLAVLNPAVALEKHPFVMSILKGNGQVFQADNEVDTPHYILVGDRCFRLETDHGKAKAVASFNNPDIAAKLKLHFNSLIQQSYMKKHTCRAEKTPTP
ncbi:MAG TPA: hypothetical protein ENH23_04380 [candidate division Zixibacteria bacterium]|nr:hypothetical protein [candidate division Zixibacteria bacterium]